MQHDIIGSTSDELDTQHVMPNAKLSSKNNDHYIGSSFNRFLISTYTYFGLIVLVKCVRVWVILENVCMFLVFYCLSCFWRHMYG